MGGAATGLFFRVAGVGVGQVEPPIPASLKPITAKNPKLEARSPKPEAQPYQSATGFVGFGFARAWGAGL